MLASNRSWTHLHRKRGTQYREEGRGLLQTSQPLVDMAELVAYRGEDGRLWFRPAGEFDDSARFEPLGSMHLKQGSNLRSAKALASNYSTRGRQHENADKNEYIGRYPRQHASAKMNHTNSQKLLPLFENSPKVKLFLWCYASITTVGFASCFFMDEVRKNVGFMLLMSVGWFFVVSFVLSELYFNKIEVQAWHRGEITDKDLIGIARSSLPAKPSAADIERQRDQSENILWSICIGMFFSILIAYVTDLRSWLGPDVSELTFFALGILQMYLVAFVGGWVAYAILCARSLHGRG